MGPIGLQSRTMGGVVAKAVIPIDGWAQEGRAAGTPTGPLFQCEYVALRDLFMGAGQSMAGGRFVQNDRGLRAREGLLQRRITCPPPSGVRQCGVSELARRVGVAGPIAGGCGLSGYDPVAIDARASATSPLPEPSPRRRGRAEGCSSPWARLRACRALLVTVARPEECRRGWPCAARPRRAAAEVRRCIAATGTAR